MTLIRGNVVRRLILSLAVALLVLLPALGVAASTEPLLVWCEPHKLNTIQDLAAKWSKETGIAVKVEPVSVLETANKVQLAGPLGKGPDVFPCLSGQLGMLVSTGTVSPIEKSLLDLKHFIEVGIEAATYFGKLYGVPYDISSVALIYNRELMPDPPDTMAELIQRSRELKVRGLFGVLWPLENFYYTYGIMKGYGGYVFGKTDDEWNVRDIGLDNAGSARAIKLLKTLRDEGLVPVGTDHVVSQTKFTEKKACAIIDGPWVIAGVKQAGIKYGVAPIPKLDNGKYPAPFVSLKWWHISSYSKRKGDALKFIAYITSADAMYKSFKAAEGIPTRTDVLAMTDVRSTPEVAGFGAQASYCSVLPDIPAMNAVWTPMNQAIELALRGDKTPEAALADAVTTIRQAIAEMK